MARPTKLYLDYFSHDTDAVNDEKMDVFRSVYGNDGYAFYFIILERAYRTESATIDLSKNIFVIGLAKKLMITVEKFYEMLETAFELEMFDRELFETEKMLTSNGIQKRFADVMKQRNQWKKSKDNNTNEFSNEKNSNNYEFSNEKTIGKTRQRKGNRKEIEIKEEEIKKDIVSDSDESFSVSESVISLNNFLISKMKMNNPNAKIPSDLKKWHDAIRLMMDTDGYTEQQVSEMIDFSQKDGFWKANILSATKLREKAGTLILQMGRVTDAKYRSSGEGTVGTDSGYKINDNTFTDEQLERIREKARQFEENKSRLQQMSG